MKGIGMPAKKTTTTRRKQPPAPPAPPGETPQPLHEAADVLKARAAAVQSESRDDGANADPEPDPPKRKRGRPKGSSTRRKPEQDVESTVAIMGPALHYTFAPMLRAAELQPDFTAEQADVLARAWEPVLRLYLKDSKSPWGAAIFATAVAFAPYGVQLGMRAASKRRASNDSEGRGNLPENGDQRDV
jgi:hypothetical protein